MRNLPDEDKNQWLSQLATHSSSQILNLHTSNIYLLGALCYDYLLGAYTVINSYKTTVKHPSFSFILIKCVGLLAFALNELR